MAASSSGGIRSSCGSDGVDPQRVPRVGLLHGERGDRPALRVIGVEQPAIRRRPALTKASFQARLCASATPVLPPNPPVGGITWAESPARNTRPRWNDSAVTAMALQRWTLSMLIRLVRLAAEAVRTSSMHRSIEDIRAHVGVAAAVGVERREDGQEPRVAGDREPEEARQLGVVDVHDAEIAAAASGGLTSALK